ncbi:PP2C family protein-serine/threonine phosphatase [Streptomyces sp. WMMB 322]|uniref:PP2C family protein-serine/threonine phosphatase n=1 Tax=Streptomyces sp. WMMB 322 TaxID=1286821 RepID=UPI0006E39B1E|nr:PP2C family protein-serine/threonine phosphatase [Streptomyces sp. WMMB 322]SCK39101.1 Serine phosphatase RsbU, regulator of sigma subunit [Streptomyces sp. WMMB 322]
MDAGGTSTTKHLLERLRLPAGVLHARNMVGGRRTDLLPGWVKALPPSLVLLALVLELLTPGRYSFASFLTAAVVLAALLSRPAVTLLIGLLSVGLLIGLHVALTDVYPENVTGPVITLILVTGFSALLSMILERTTLQLVQVQAVAEATQRALLRPLPERLGHVRMAGLYRAADEAALIGGDLYSVRPTPYGVRAVIGDVRGKGIGATEGVATITSAFREAAMSCPALSEVAQRIEGAMAMDREDMEVGGSLAVPVMGTPRGWAQEMFATAVLLEFPHEGGCVRILSRGHPPVFRLGGPEGVVPLTPEPALPLGFGDLWPGGPVRETTYRLTEGEALIACSDGVTEARSRDGGFYPLERRLEERYSGASGTGRGAVGGHLRGVGGPGGIDPSEVVSFVHRDVTRWAESINDDLVIVVLQQDAGAHTATRASLER